VLLRLAVKRMQEQYHVVNEVREARLCHHDYSDRNVLIGRLAGGPQLLAVIDFEHCCPWDKDFDLIQFYGKMHVQEPHLAEEFLTGYKSIWHDIDAFYDKLDLYYIRELLTACAWSYQRVPDYYRKSLGDLKRLLRTS
ncbi:MAG: phosphotransferase, partial [Bacillota bacterium]